MNEPYLSVVIPCYNEEKPQKRCFGRNRELFGKPKLSKCQELKPLMKDLEKKPNGAVCHGEDYKFPDWIFDKAEKKMKKADPSGQKYREMVNLLKRKSDLTDIYV